MTEGTAVTAPAAAQRSFYVNQRGRILALKIVAVVALVLLLISRSVWEPGGLAVLSLRAMGTCLILAAALGRLWCALYIGGRKNALLVTSGPYSMSRNPLYFFSVLGAAGIGLVFGSLAVALVLSLCTAMVLLQTSRAEANLLAARFGRDYAAYAQRVPLLWPRHSLYRDTDFSSFQPRAVGRMFRDSLLFLLALPAAELTDYARANGWLPPLVPLF